MGKSLATSKTFWVNALTALVASAATITALVQGAYPPAVAYVAAGLAIANIVLRLITGEPIKSIV